MVARCARTAAGSTGIRMLRAVGFLAIVAWPAVAPARPLTRIVAADKALVDRTATGTGDFLAGTFTGTAISEIDSAAVAGQLRLAPSFSDLFLSATLDSAWNVIRPTSGYTPVISGGVLDVQERDDTTYDATALQTAATFGPGSVFEGRAMINAGSAFNNIGFIGNWTSPDQWAYFSTRGSGNTQVPVIQTSVRGADGTLINVPTSVSLGEWHDFRIEWMPDSLAFYVDGALVDTRANPGIDIPLRVGLYKSENSATAFPVDWLRVVPYAALDGTYESPALDAGSPGAAWSRLDWQGDLPAGGAVGFACRTGETALPDTSWSAWSDVQGDTIASPPGRYVQYRVSLAAADSVTSPVIDEVRLAYAVVDTTAPQVVGIMPPDSSTGIVVDTAVSATFDGALDPATVDASTFTLDQAGGASVPATVQYDPATSTATLVPDAPLAAGTAYEARLWPTLADPDGNQIGVLQVWTFTTALPDTIPPRVAVKVPAPGAVEVLPGVPVFVTFSEPMDPATLTAATCFVQPQGGAPVAATVAYDQDSRTVSVTPDQDLAAASAYEVHVTTGATDLAGLPLANDAVWGFTTRVTPASYAVATSLTDFGAGTASGVTVCETDSSAAGGQLRLETRLAEAFTDTLLPSTFHVVQPSEGAYAPAIAGGVLDVQQPDSLNVLTSSIEAYPTWGPHVVMEARAMFIPGSKFVDVGLDASTDFNSQYAWFSTAGTGNDPGNELITCRIREYDHTTVAIATDAAYNQWHVFRIEWTAGRLDFSIDGVPVCTRTNVLITAPMRPAFYKSNDSPDTGLYIDWVRVTPYAAVSGTWTSPVEDAGAAGAAWTELHWQGSTPGGTDIAFSTRTGETAVPDSTWSGWTAVVNRTVASPAGRYAQYRAELGTADAVVSPALDEVRLYYDPDAAVDHLAVVATTPTVAASDMALESAVDVTFNRPLDPASLDGTSFSLTPEGGSPVAATVSYVDSTRTAVLTPAALLSPTTVYVARLSTAVADTAGLHLPADFQWSFTTGAYDLSGVALPGLRTELLPNVPNPFNPSTVVAFDLARAGEVRLRIYGVDGALVRTLASGNLAAGRHEFTWDGRDDAGRGASTGVYFARLETPDGPHTRKMTLLK